MTPSGHGPVVSSPPTGSGDSDCFKFPRHAHGQAHRGPWQGLLSPPRLAGRDGRALTLQGTVIIARGPESALRGPQGSPSPSLCFTGSMNSRLPPPLRNLLDKPRIPWPKSGEVWALKDHGSGILTSSWFWNPGGLESRIPRGGSSRTLMGMWLGPGIHNFGFNSWSFLEEGHSVLISPPGGGWATGGRGVLPQRHTHRAGPSEAQPPVECDLWFPCARPLLCLSVTAGPVSSTRSREPAFSQHVCLRSTLHPPAGKAAGLQAHPDSPRWQC